MAERKKRIGRPTKPGTAGQRNSLGLRVTAEIKRKIEAGALKSGRSQSQEAEFLIEEALLKEEAYGGRELLGLVKLMVGAAEIIQAKTGKSWSSDWETSIKVREAWTNLAAAVGASPPAEYIQHVQQVDELPQPPELPTRPSPPGGGDILQWYAYQSRTADAADAKAFEAEMAVFQKAWKKYDRLSAKYERQLKALRQDAMAWFKANKRYQDLGKAVAAELLPRREAVIQTAIPAQRVEKTKEK